MCSTPRCRYLLQPLDRVSVQIFEAAAVKRVSTLCRLGGIVDFAMSNLGLFS